MAERDEQRFNQIGLAFRLATDQFAYADMQKNDYFLLGFRSDQVDKISYSQVMARARDIVVKAIAQEPLPKVFVPEEQKPAEERKVVMPSTPQYDPVAENDVYAKDKSQVNPDEVPSRQDQLTNENAVEVDTKEDRPRSSTQEQEAVIPTRSAGSKRQG